MTHETSVSGLPAKWRREAEENRHLGGSWHATEIRNKLADELDAAPRDGKAVAPDTCFACGYRSFHEHPQGFICLHCKRIHLAPKSNAALVDDAMVKRACLSFYGTDNPMTGSFIAMRAALLAALATRDAEKGGA